MLAPYKGGGRQKNNRNNNRQAAIPRNSSGPDYGGGQGVGQMMRFDDRPIEDVHHDMMGNRNRMVERMDNMHNDIMKNAGEK